MSIAAFTTPTSISSHRYSVPSINRSSTFQRLNHAQKRTKLRMVASNDLLIVGCGELGRKIGQQWRDKHQSSRIVGETRTDKSHELIKACGITPIIQGQSEETFEKVVFCASPRNNNDYSGAVSAATHRVSQGGRFVFTSSAGIYLDTNGIVSEKCETASGERAERLGGAEGEALKVENGAVLRLSGLYTLERGPHNVWLQMPKVAADGNGLINMIHYEDAASAAIRALEVEELLPAKEDRLFLISAEEITREEICSSARLHPMYSGFDMPEFEEGNAMRLRRYDNSWSRSFLGWKPKYENFCQFMKAASHKS